MEELNELKNLVMQNLEKNGYLSNIRAQIRSSVFKTIDSQDSGKKISPFFSQNLKVQKLTESSEGQKSLALIQQLLQFYEMENSLKIFNSETNMKNEVKRDQLAVDNSVQPKNEQPVLYKIFSNFLAKNRKVNPPKREQKIEKLSQMPVQMKEDESEGQIEEDISRNESRKFGESEQFGQSQGYDVTVDSLKLQEYDYYEQIE